MSEVDIIHPSQISIYSLVVMVTKNDGSWHMYLDYRQLNKMTIKDMFLIPVIDKLSDESSFCTSLN